MKIYKYELAVQDFQVVKIPAGAEILTLQVQNGVPCIWARISDAGKYDYDELRSFVTIGTGHNFSSGRSLIYIGTYQLGAFVGHVFEERGIRQ